MDFRNAISRGVLEGHSERAEAGAADGDRKICTGEPDTGNDSLRDFRLEG